jgi:ankyrin repeat protein
MTPNQSLSVKPREDAAPFGALHTPLSDQAFADYMDLSGLEYLNSHTNTAILTPSEESVPPTVACQDSVQASAALHLAAKEGQTRILSILLRTGFRADSRDERGRTPLHHCASLGHTETAKVLLDAGASINAVDMDGTSVILAAVKAGSEKMVELILSYKR